MEAPVSHFIELLTQQRRVLLLGGLAVVAHGLSRGTKDADVWMEPCQSPDEWLAAIQAAVEQYPSPLSIHCLPGWKELKGHDLISSIEQVGMVRINGLTMPLDIFRRPNGYDIDQFDDVWENASGFKSGMRLPRAADLLPTKEATGRTHDTSDLHYLLAISRTEQGNALASAETIEQARSILDDYYDHEVCKRGLGNPDKEIQNLIQTELKKLADDGDPFAMELLENHR